MQHKYKPQPQKAQSGKSVFECETCGKRTTNENDSTPCIVKKSLVGVRRYQKTQRTQFKKASANYWYYQQFKDLKNYE